MEANEALARIGWRHRWLLLVCIAMALVIAVPSRAKSQVSYGASARIQVQSAAPDADTQAAAMVSRTLAVASSPSVIAAALQSAGLHLDPQKVVKQVSVTSLGSSAVDVITVHNAVRATAVNIASQLAQATVDQINSLSTQSVRSLLPGIDATRNQLIAAGSALAAQLQSVNAVKPPAGTDAATLAARVQLLTNQLTGLESSLQQALATAAPNGTAGVISLPLTATPSSRGLTTAIGLAILLGLVVGLLFSAIHEFLRPSVSDAESFARELSTPLLGRTRGAFADGLPAEIRVATIAAAHRTGVRTLVIAGPAPRSIRALVSEGLVAVNQAAPVSAPPLDPWAGLEARAARDPRASVTTVGRASSQASVGRDGRVRRAIGNLDTLDALDGPERRPQQSSRARLEVRLFEDLTAMDVPQPAGLVVVATRFSPFSSVRRAEDLSASTGWQTIGVVGVDGSVRKARQAVARFGRPLGSRAE
jgi:capsular polysaccharide biosynthesis protein